MGKTEQHNFDLCLKYQIRIKELKEAMQEFVNRVDKGEVRSVKTYTKFKELLAKDNLY